MEFEAQTKAKAFEPHEILFEHGSDFYYCSNAQDCVLESALTAIILLGAAAWDNQMALQEDFQSAASVSQQKTCMR